MAQRTKRVVLGPDGEIYHSKAAMNRQERIESAGEKTWSKIIEMPFDEHDDHAPAQEEE